METTLMSKDEIILPNILYKYRNWDSEYDRNVLFNGQLYYSSPKKFEDNKDCTAHVRYDLLNDHMIFQAYFYRSKEDNKHFTSRKQHRDFARDWVKKTRIRDKVWVEKEQKRHLENYFNLIGVLSLALKQDNFDMWSKYSNNFKGVCYGFDPKILINKANGGGEVSYYNELPKILPEPFHSFEQQSNTRVFAKEDFWKFENEYRLLKIFINGNIDRQVNYGNNAIKEVILGQDIKEENKAEIVNFIEKECKNIKLFTAKYDTEKNVKIQSININQ